MRAGGAPVTWDWHGFSRFEVRLAAFCAVVTGILFADTSSTTVLGGFGMFGLGAMAGVLFGLRIAGEYPDPGRFFRGFMLVAATLFVLMDAVAVTGWVLGDGLGTAFG